ncbi:hypothetical protein [Halobiforma nitratireducens]|uniref:Uncharacterized protein n=1 Tax=Halobiforma nitratireducens JCM 10879 TaxID=1227454 RepID=M0M7A9_9EURY|nr:hypothetical protein [Halobiforma nitratireducens]EMA41702.1 hypothetical protein C446_05285 [Halobiforma nitratireducens JCM 10879]
MSRIDTRVRCGRGGTTAVSDEPAADTGDGRIEPARGGGARDGTGTPVGGHSGGEAERNPDTDANENANADYDQ